MGFLMNDHDQFEQKVDDYVVGQLLLLKTTMNDIATHNDLDLRYLLGVTPRGIVMELKDLVARVLFIILTAKERVDEAEG